jgi:ring-1,2-phenylacetyl-CoA epoxidase subunit PaaA
MFEEKIGLNDFANMDSEYQELLRRLLAIQADCEIGGPHLYLPTIFRLAPSRLEQLAVARTAAEEFDHYRKFARLAGDIGLDVSYVLSWPNEKRYVEAFRGKIATWEEYAIFGFLIDRVGKYQLEEFMNCSYQPLATITPGILKEELGHVGHGFNKTIELLAERDESRIALQEALDRWYPKALDMFGRSKSKRSERYIYWGLKRRSNEQARIEFIAEVNPLIKNMGLRVPGDGLGRLYN